ncbi:MAG TPA: SDR family NAD(P)-dependent oxidoreductase [Epulopiscium sp.]|nr:SDR family NAD(P)-dependent oxidoreductase [Candidatus Epulonipiscium sp.]
MNLQGKRVVLTGASSGIGLELLPLLHQKGAKVLAVGRRAYTPEFPSIIYIREDVSTKEGVDNIFNMAQEVLGGVDVFIANAGFAYYEGAQKADWERTKTIFDTNVSSPIYAFYKLKKIKKNKPFQFVVTASAISYLPLPGYGLYSGTKHAIQGFFEAARHELPKHQVITLIHPVATKTAFFKENTPIPFPTQTAVTVAKRYIKGIESNKAHIFPSKLFWVVRHLSILQPLVQKHQAHQFNQWRKKYE